MWIKIKNKTPKRNKRKKTRLWKIGASSSSHHHHSPMWFWFTFFPLLLWQRFYDVFRIDSQRIVFFPLCRATAARQESTFHLHVWIKWSYLWSLNYHSALSILSFGSFSSERDGLPLILFFYLNVIDCILLNIFSSSFIFLFIFSVEMWVWFVWFFHQISIQLELRARFFLANLPSLSTK